MEASSISGSFLKALAVVEGAVVVADVVVGRDHAWKMLGSRRSWKVLYVKIEILFLMKMRWNDGSEISHVVDRVASR